MFSAAKPLMKQCIKNWFQKHPKAREWAWFAGLWCLGLGAVLIMAYPIKLVIKNMS